MCSLLVCRGEWRQRRVFVFEIMSHTQGSTITDCCWAIGISSPSQEKSKKLVEEVKQYYVDIGVSLTRIRGSGTVDLNGAWKLFCSGANPSMSAQAGVRILTSPGVSDCVSDWIPLGSRVCMLKIMYWIGH